LREKAEILYAKVLLAHMGRNHAAMAEEPILHHRLKVQSGCRDSNQLTVTKRR